MKKSPFILTSFLLFSFQAVEASNVLRFPARYQVPVSESDLQPFAEFELADYQVLEAGEQSELQYSLPLELTGGEEIKIHLKQMRKDQGERVFLGENGFAACTGPWAQMTCKTQIFISPDPQKIKSYIESHVEKSRQEQVLRVARRFSTEPIGFSQTFIKP